MKLSQRNVNSRIKFNLLLIFLLSSSISDILIAQITVKPVGISNDSLTTQDSRITPDIVEPLKPKQCSVNLTDAIAYILNPVDLNSDKYIFDIPLQYYGKVVKNGDDFEVYFPNKHYAGHKLVFSVPPSDGGLYNYNNIYNKVPISILEDNGVYIPKGDYKYCKYFIEVKQKDSWKRIYGVNNQSHIMRFVDMGFDKIEIGEYYTVNVYSFDSIGQRLEQSFKIYLKYCSVTDSNECP